MRLVFQDRAPYQLWNTPAPPSLSLCPSTPRHAHVCQTLYTAEMDHATGFTFFYISSKLSSLHVHHSGEPSALNTFIRTFPNRQRRFVAWIYLPVAKRDRVLLVGIRQGQESWARCIVVRTQLAGDVLIGQPREGPFWDSVLGACPPLTLVYGDPKPSTPFRFFGVHCRIPLDHHWTPPEPPRLPQPSGSPIGDIAYFSWAPLSDVSSAEVFYDKRDGACRGILFRCQHGGARAVGQCRIHVDPSRTVVRPARLYFEIESGPSWQWDEDHKYTVHVRFEQTPRTAGESEHGAAGESEHGTSEEIETRTGRESEHRAVGESQQGTVGESEDGITEGSENGGTGGAEQGHKMEGIIKFWFTTVSCFVVVENGVSLTPWIEIPT